MEIFTVAAAAVVACVCAVVLDSQKNKEYALFVSLAFGVLALLLSVKYITPLLTSLSRFAEAAQLGSTELNLVIKIIAISYLSGFAADICRDANKAAIAAKVELFARAAIGFFSLPIIISLFELISSLL